jgi:CRP/FNR family transcriptional regulator, cyclic AMP receptor protein
MPLTASRREALLAGCPLFAGLEPPALAALAAAVVEVEFAAGRTIAREGEIGTGLFVVVEGGVRVVQGGVTIANLGPEDFFGELSVLDGGPRIAAVVTDAPTTCLALASWDLERVLHDEPGAALAVLRVIAGRLREASADHRA